MNLQIYVYRIIGGVVAFTDKTKRVFQIHFFILVCLFQGLRKRDLLTEVLPVIGQNLRFQRLFTEYQDQLELLRLK